MAQDVGVAVPCSGAVRKTKSRGTGVRAQLDDRFPSIDHVERRIAQNAKIRRISRPHRGDRVKEQSEDQSWKASGQPHGVFVVSLAWAVSWCCRSLPLEWGWFG